MEDNAQNTIKCGHSSITFIFNSEIPKPSIWICILITNVTLTHNFIILGKYTLTGL